MGVCTMLLPAGAGDPPMLVLGAQLLKKMRLFLHGCCAPCMLKAARTARGRVRQGELPGAQAMEKVSSLWSTDCWRDALMDSRVVQLPFPS